MDALILQRADHLEPRAIADVRKARIAVAAEVALEDLAVLGTVEHGAPGFELANAIRRFPGVQFRHAPVVDVLAAAHGVGEVDFPAVAIVDVGERRGDAPFGHPGGRLAEPSLAYAADVEFRGRVVDRMSQPLGAYAHTTNNTHSLVD